MGKRRVLMTVGITGLAFRKVGLAMTSHPADRGMPPGGIVTEGYAVPALCPGLPMDTLTLTSKRRRRPPV